MKRSRLDYRNGSRFILARSYRRGFLIDEEQLLFHARQFAFLFLHASHYLIVFLVQFANLLIDAFDVVGRFFDFDGSFLNVVLWQTDSECGYGLKYLLH